MEILYPLPSLAGAEPGEDASLTVLVNHTVPAVKKPAFLDALRVMLGRAGSFPGSLGSAIFQQEEGALARITILHRFASVADRDAWLASRDFATWQEAIAATSCTLEHVRTYSGMEALFAAGRADAPPRWKMALVLLIAVLPLSFALSQWFGKALSSIPPLTGALITSPIMVLLMTYVLVPLLTKLFAGWLQPEGGRK